MRFGPFTMMIMAVMAVIFSVLAIRNNEHVLQIHQQTMGIEQVQEQAQGALAPEVFISVILLAILGGFFFILKKKGKLDSTKKKVIMALAAVITVFALFTHFTKDDEEPAQKAVPPQPVQTQAEQPVQTQQEVPQQPATTQQQVQRPAGAPPAKFNQDEWGEFDKKFENFDDKFKNF